MTPAVSVVTEVSRFRGIIEYPSCRFAAVAVRLSFGSPPNVTAGKGTVVLPSFPVRAMVWSHSGAGLVAPVDRYSSCRAHESAGTCAGVVVPSSMLVSMAVSRYLAQNVGEMTLQVAPDEHVRSVGTSVRSVAEVNVTCAVGVPYPLPDCSP